MAPVDRDGRRGGLGDRVRLAEVLRAVGGPLRGRSPPTPAVLPQGARPQRAAPRLRRGGRLHASRRPALAAGPAGRAEIGNRDRRHAGADDPLRLRDPDDDLRYLDVPDRDAAHRREPPLPRGAPGAPARVGVARTARGMTPRQLASFWRWARPYRLAYA